MAYSKQTWDTTSYVNPTRMNHIEDGIYAAQETADSKTKLDIENLFSNKYISTADTWDKVEGIADIDNYEYLGFSFGRSDNNPDQSAIRTIISVEAFKLSSTDNPISIVEDYLTLSDTKAVLVCYRSDTSIRMFRGSSVFQFSRLSMYGIAKKS